jgi:hypothetical protein
MKSLFIHTPWAMKYAGSEELWPSFEDRLYAWLSNCKNRCREWGSGKHFVSIVYIHIHVYVR